MLFNIFIILLLNFYQIVLRLTNTMKLLNHLK
nr:MAG TPA: hypothetical protein [Caudoviricetes sp.]